MIYPSERFLRLAEQQERREREKTARSNASNIGMYVDIIRHALHM